ncbi:MAG TPA: hypothetical protein VKX28_04125 [Xanthobacteraceae bacterium]|nr:hypothetical protein [Xanthobacteraceae bacterium]
MLRAASLACACLVGALAGCAVIDPVDKRYDTINRSLATARNESILLNLARASRDYPLNFVTIANVTPSLTNTSSFALPSFLLGGSPHNIEPTFSPGRDININNTTASNTTAVSTNFNVSTQETSAFYTGFLKPIDLLTLDYFIRQGYSRELLFWLFTESVEAAPPVGPSLLLSYKPPDDYGCPKQDPKKRCFQEFVLIAMYTGLTVEQRSVTRPAPKGGQNTGAGGNKRETTSFFRFCFDPLLAERARNAMTDEWRRETERYLDFRPDPKLLNPQCGKEWDPRKDEYKPQKDTFEFFVGPIKFRIRPRSAFGIFEFLGTLIKMERDHPTPWEGANTWDRASVLEPPTLKTAHDDHDLFRVDFANARSCFAQTWFNDETYCVPEDAHNTKRIFNLLAQLIAIETAANDLSITPTVRVIQ